MPTAARWACCEDGQLTGGFPRFLRRLPPSPPPPIANVWGDPHFLGFDGSRFDYHGKAGSTYTLLSATGVKIASLFAHAADTPLDTTVLGSVVFAAGKDVVSVVLTSQSGKKGMLGEQRACERCL